MALPFAWPSPPSPPLESGVDAMLGVGCLYEHCSCRRLQLLHVGCFSSHCAHRWGKLAVSALRYQNDNRGKAKKREREFTLGRAFLRPCDRRRTLTLRALHCMHPIRLFTCDFLSPMVAATRLSTRPLSVLFHPPAAPRMSVTLPARQSGSPAAGQLENDENNGKSEKSN